MRNGHFECEWTPQWLVNVWINAHCTTTIHFKVMHFGATRWLFHICICNFDNFSRISEHGKNQNGNKTYLAFHLLYPIPFNTNIVFCLFHTQHKNTSFFTDEFTTVQLDLHINFVVSLQFFSVFIWPLPKPYHCVYVQGCGENAVFILFYFCLVKKYKQMGFWLNLYTKIENIDTTLLFWCGHIDPFPFIHSQMPAYFICTM